MFCDNCGGEIPPEATFCPSCGGSTSSESDDILSKAADKTVEVTERVIAKTLTVGKAGLEAVGGTAGKAGDIAVRAGRKGKDVAKRAADVTVETAEKVGEKTVEVAKKAADTTEKGARKVKESLEK